MSRLELRIAKFIIGGQFGEVVEKVAMTLVSKGGLPLSLLQQHTHLAQKQVKESLFVLIQHNIVKYQLANTDDGQPSVQSSQATYYLDLRSALLRLAHPVFIVMAEEELTARGKDEEQVKLVSDLLLNIVKNGRFLCSSADEAVRDLLTCRFIEVCNHDCSIYHPTLSVIPPLSVSPKRHSTAANALNNILSSTDTSSPKRLKNILIEEKTSPTDIYVRLNNEVFINLLKKLGLISIVSNKINEAAGAVMRAALYCSGLDGCNGSLFSAFQVSSQLPPGTPLLVDNSWRGMPLAHASPTSQYLECMTQQLDFFQKEDNKAGGTFSVDYRKAVRCLRLSYLESFIKERFGQGSVRIFRLLQSQRMLEEKTISKVTMMTPKETRERLYQMLRYGLLHLQEVPKTVDHAPSRTFFLWTIPENTIYTDHSERALKIIANLLERAQVERNKNEMLISKSERSDVVSNPLLLSTPEQRQLANLRKILNRFGSYEHRILSEYLVFLD